MTDLPQMQKVKVKKRGDRTPLYTICTPVEDVEEFRPILLGMLNLVYKEKLHGLSANQCGINKQAFITDVPGDAIRVFINPVVTIVDHDMAECDEECCSFSKPRERYRHKHVVVDALNSAGDRFVLDTTAPDYERDDIGSRIAARVQHEMEHMLGLDVRVEPTVSLEQTSLADLLVQPERRYHDSSLLDDYISGLLARGF